jgi:hypothetical protein
MVTIKTNVPKAIYNNRGTKISDEIIYLIINSIESDTNGTRAKGFYFYKKTELIDDVANPITDEVTGAVIYAQIEHITDVILDAINQYYTWEQVAQAEQYAHLPTINTSSFKDALFVRTKQFTKLQQQIDSGKNFGILFTDWDFS